jgi:hypothetical protein
MKLSELKTLVALMEQGTDDINPDPEVSFWLPRSVERAVKDAGPRAVFIDVVPHMCHTLNGVSRHKTFDEGGDYSWPLELVK